jgi:hypothetical protein
MSEVQTALNSAISLVHKTTQIAQPPTRIPSISKVSRDTSGRITVAFHYDPSQISKTKTRGGHKWTSGLCRNYLGTRMSARLWFTPLENPAF